MMTVRLPNPPDAFERVFVADVATQRIARVRGVCDDPTLAHDIRGTADQPGLRVDRMDLEVLAQGGGQEVRSIWAIIRGPFSRQVFLGRFAAPMQSLLELFPLIAFFVA